MQQALITLAVLVVAGIVGLFLPPSEEQTRPLVPEAGGGDIGHDAHHGSHH
jgi:hypothetical protein